MIVNYPPINTPPSGDDDLHIVQREKPPPHLLQSAAPETAEEDPGHVMLGEPSRLSSVSRPTFVGGMLLVILAFSVGFMYLLEHRWPARAGTAPQPDTSSALAPDSVALAAKPGLIPLHPDMLRVTAIALGNPRLAIVNGKRVAEGESLVVATSAGPTGVRVEKIEDGFVRFAHDGELIEAKLVETAARKSPPP